MREESPIVIYHGTNTVVKNPEVRVVGYNKWDYVEDFLSGRITREAFWALARFKHPTHQIIFCTDTALNTLRFKSYYQL